MTSRRRKDRERGPSRSGKECHDEVRIRAEVEYIVDCAAERSTRIVRLGELVFFSTATGDAWMLDPGDGLALPLARSGDRLPARILETEERFLIEWTHDYRVDGELFCVVERETGHVTTIAGYPTGGLPQS